MTDTLNDYLGDGVYVSFDGYQIWLAANHPDNKVIALEPDVYSRLEKYVDRLIELQKQAAMEKQNG